jgi:hypothetical protein
MFRRNLFSPFSRPKYTINLEAAGSSETSGTTHETARCPDDNNINDAVKCLLP